MQVTAKLLDRLLAEVEGVEIRHELFTLSEEDTSLFRFALLSRIALEVDALQLGSIYDSTFRRVILRVKCINVMEYFKGMKALKLSLIGHFNSQEYQGSERSWRKFKASLEVPPYLVGPLKPFYMKGFRESIQWLSFDERLNFTSVDYKSLILDDYLIQEQEMREIRYPDEIVAELNKILIRNLRNLNLWDQPPVPTNGPGSVAGMLGRPSSYWKYSTMYCDKDFIVDIANAFGLQDGGDILPSNIRVVDGDSWRTSELVVVPKNALTGRTISKEPVALQWVQQAVKQHIYSYVDSTPSISTVFSDQSYARALCCKGSFEGKYSTIDFSSASDWISVRLVDKLFVGTPLHDILLNSRSLYCKVSDEETIALDKFAPMGSALCFPTMSLIFDAICRYVAGEAARPRRNYFVYGDDVVLETKFVPRFLEVCTSIGFKPNVAKSYYHQPEGRCAQYREACGVECVGGIDITPLRLSRKLVSPILKRNYFEGHVPSAERWVGFIDLMNSAYIYGFRTFRSLMNALFITRDPKRYYSFARLSLSDYQQGVSAPLPYVVTADGTDTQWRNKFGRDSDLHSNYVKVLSVTTKTEEFSKDVSTTFHEDPIGLELSLLDMDNEDFRRLYPSYHSKDLQFSRLIDKLYVDLPREAGLIKDRRAVLKYTKWYK